MRIQNNVASLNAWRNLNTTNGNQGKALERLSSGYRINRAADDAAGLAISEKMRAQVRGLNQSIRNANDGISLIQTAEGALTETHAILQRMRELAVQSSNGTLQSGDQDQIDAEFQALKTEVTRIATDTKFNGKTLLDTAAQKIEIVVSTDASSTITVTLDKMDDTTLATPADVKFADVATAKTGIAALDAAIDTVATQRADLGAAQNRLEHTINNLSVTAENLTASESRIRDTDMAQEMANLTKQQILQQAGMAMLAQANQAPQGVLSLLR